MSSISGVSGGGTGWQDVSNRTGGTGRRERMFAKADGNGDGSVDGTELQGVLDQMAQRSGGTAANADDALKTMDSDGNGTLDAGELDAGMKQLMPAPASTLDFAQQRGDERVDGGDGPPPRLDSEDASGATASDSADGLRTLLADLLEAADTDGNGNLNKSEIDTLKTHFDSALQTLSDGTGSTTASTSDSTGTVTAAASSDSTATATAAPSSDMVSTLTALANLVLKEYASTAASGTATQTTAISLSA